MGKKYKRSCGENGNKNEFEKANSPMQYAIFFLQGHEKEQISCLYDKNIIDSHKYKKQKTVKIAREKGGKRVIANKNKNDFGANQRKW